MASSRLRDPGFLTCSSPFSFKDALSGFSSISVVFLELKVSSFRGMPSLWISEMEIESLAAPFEFSLVRKFLARRPSLDAIRKFFFNLKLKGDVSVTVLNNRNVLIKLFNDLDYCRVFAQRSYFVNNCFMKLVKWSPTLDVEIESPVIPIWISFPNLRPHLFASRILHGLGKIFGYPLKTDNATSTGSRPSVARVLVEIDVTKKFPNKIWVGPENAGYVQSVVFEEFPEYCVHCSSLVHSKAGCTILHPNIIPFSSLGEGGRTGVRNVVDCLIETGNVIDSSCEKVMGCEYAAADISLSPNAIPFIPSSVVNGLGPKDVIEEISDIVLVPEVVSDPVNVAIPPAECGRGSEVSLVLGVVEDCGRPMVSVRNVESNVCGQVVNSDVQDILDNLVNVPVTVSGTYGFDVKSHGDWLHNSSEFGYDSESYSDPGNEFKMDCGVALKVASRGKFWKRGGRRR
ncbi:hypothetical protein MA16_Dca011902 [Dendrobium catenatum]|uniref:DUF4283 domain-containing protein n=1 Tax=Dendrobium catenatum TaxID=906689 RepID=A0A2I0W2J2_9ASPA|nr:hypothetical protein MA16_Dca011902 [Dendrobium catenatum]